MIRDILEDIREKIIYEYDMIVSFDKYQDINKLTSQVIVIETLQPEIFQTFDKTYFDSYIYIYIHNENLLENLQFKEDLSDYLESLNECYRLFAINDEEPFTSKLQNNLWIDRIKIKIVT